MPPLSLLRPAPARAPVAGATPPARAGRRAPPVAAPAASAAAMAARARPLPRPLAPAPAATRRQPLQEDDDSDDEDDALFLAALADLDAEEEDEAEAEGPGPQQQEAAGGDQGDDAPDAADALLLPPDSTSGDPYLLPGFGIEQEDGGDSDDDNESETSNQQPKQRRQRQRRRQPPSHALTLAALTAAVLASADNGASSSSSLSSREIVRSLGAWARLCASERKSTGVEKDDDPAAATTTTTLRLLLLAAAERSTTGRLSATQAAGALRATAQCCAALAGVTGGDSGAAGLLPWPAVAALFGKLLLPDPDLLPPRAACEALWAAGALHARLSQDAAARRAAERHAALAPPPRPPPTRRFQEDDGPASQQQQRAGKKKRRRGPAADPPAPRPGEDARSELARLFLREDGVAGTLPPQSPDSSASPAPLVRSEAQDHALAVAASAAEAAAVATSPPRTRLFSSSLTGLPPDVLSLACRLCDAFVAAYNDDDDQAPFATTVPLPELAAAAAAVARLQRPPGALFRLLERRLCAEGGRELRAAATRDLVTIAWAAGTAAEDAVMGSGKGAAPAAPSFAPAASATNRRRLDTPADQVASVAQSIAPRSLMACIASECRRRLERDAEARARFAALAEARIAEREQRERGVGLLGGVDSSSPPSTPTLWPDNEAAGQLQDAELPVARTRKQAEWLEELDELLRRSGAAGAEGGAEPATATKSALAPTSSSSSPRLALLATEGERHLRPGGLMDRLAAADAARRQAALEASAASSFPPDQRVGPAEAASLLVATARAAYLDDAFVDACLRAHGDAWASAAGTGAGTWPLRAGARPPRASARQRGALARVSWALSLLGRCPAHDEDALLRHAVDALAGSEAAVMSALPGDVLDLTRALAAGRVRLAAPVLRRWTARGIARAVAEGAGFGVMAAKRRLDDSNVVLPTPADALLPDQVAALALAAARLPRGAGAAAWAPPTALAAVSPWLSLVSPLCSPSALADLAEAYALDGRPLDDGGKGLAPVVEAAAASVEGFDAPTLARMLRSLLRRAGEARRQRRAVRRRRARLARGEGLEHDVDEDVVAVGKNEDHEEEEEDDDDHNGAAAGGAAAATERRLFASLLLPPLGPASAAARDYALESLPWRLRQRLRGSAAAPGRALLRAQAALPAPRGRPGLGDAPYVAADASDAGIEARWRAYTGGGGGEDGSFDAAAASPDLSPLLRAVDERLRPDGSPPPPPPLPLGPALALDLLAAMASESDGGRTSSASPPPYDRDRLAAWLARQVLVGQKGENKGGPQQKQRRARRAAKALRLAWAAGARLPAAGVAAPLARDAASWPGLPPAEAVDAAWALLRMGCCDGGGGEEEDGAASSSAKQLLRGAARRLERVEAEASAAPGAALLRDVVPSSLPARLLYCWRELHAGAEAAAPVPPAALALALRVLPQTPPDALCWLILALSDASSSSTEELLRLAARELGKRKGVARRRVGGPLLAEARRVVAAAAASGGGGGA